MNGRGEALARAEARDWREPWIARRATLTPDAPALVFGDQRLDYRELASRAEAAAAALARCGVSRGDIVAVYLPSGLPMVELAHASFLLDFTVQLVNTRLTAHEIDFQLRDSGAAFWLHLERDAPAAAVELPEGINRLCIADDSTAASVRGEELAHDSAPATFATQIDFDSPRFILYTSGTSGRPKGVALDAGHLFASATAQAELLGAEASDRWLVCLPLFHVGGLSILLRSVLAGSCVVVHERFEPATVAGDLEGESITGVSLVANMLGRLLEVMDGAPAPAPLDCVLLGGGATPEPLIEAARAARFPIAATYGLTEAASQVATRPPSDDPARGLPLLRATEVRIVDEEGKELPAGRAGEICLRGPTIAHGYWRNPEATAAAFRDGWFHTGDVGSLDADGRLDVFDRRSDLIISGGENVYPAEIEAVLLAHPNVAEAGVAGIEDATFGARPAAWVVARHAPVATPGQLDAFCRERLAAYKCPVEFHIVDALPRNATGKLLRRELAARDA